MGEIKTALERALEKVAKLEVEEKAFQELKYVPEGEKLAARFLKEKNFDLVTQVNQFPEEVRGYVLKGVNNILLGNINLPHNKRQEEEGKRALQGLKPIKRDKSLLSHITSRIESVFAYYGRERQECYESLRAEFERKLREALYSQGIKITAPIQVERYPEFQQKWQEISSQLDRKYESQLNMLKAELEKIR